MKQSSIKYNKPLGTQTGLNDAFGTPLEVGSVIATNNSYRRLGLGLAVVIAFSPKCIYCAWSYAFTIDKAYSPSVLRSTPEEFEGWKINPKFVVVTPQHPIPEACAKWLQDAAQNN